MASGESTVSFAMATVHRADEAAFQAPQFSEYVVVNSGTLELLTVSANGASVDKTTVEAGKGVFLPAGLPVKWTWPGPCKSSKNRTQRPSPHSLTPPYMDTGSYTVVCMPAFSPSTSGNEANAASDTVVDRKSREALAAMHLTSNPTSPHQPPPMKHKQHAPGITPLVVSPVAVVEAPGITISEHIGNVACSEPLLSVARSVVKGASQEAWQAPGFDEYVICTKGAIRFLYGDGRSEEIVAGQGVFLPKNLRVKWVWPEATNYTVLCVPAFTPALCGREAEENATVAKDSQSMERLESLHQKPPRSA